MSVPWMRRGHPVKMLSSWIERERIWSVVGLPERPSDLLLRIE